MKECTLTPAPLTRGPSRLSSVVKGEVVRRGYSRTKQRQQEQNAVILPLKNVGLLCELSEFQLFA